MFAAAILFAFVYLPNMIDANGISSKDIVLELPVDMGNIRYANTGITPFCLNKNNGIDFEVRQYSQVLAPISGTITDINTDTNQLTIQPASNVDIYLSPVTQLNVSVGDYVNSGDIVGYARDIDVHISLDNKKNSRYECPYFYFNDDSKTIITKDLAQSPNTTNKICECDNMKY
jgi:hypothetical protein